MNLHNFNSNTKSWKMYTNTLTSISGDDLLVMPSYGKDIILEVSANNDIFFKKGTITKRFDNLVSDYLDMSFVREASFNSLNSQVQYILQEISGSSVKDFITSGISNDLLIKSYDGRDIILEVSGNSEIIFKRGDFSYNLDDLIGGGGGSQSSDYATYNILDITGKIIFTDNSGTSGTSGNSGSSSNIILTSISGDIIPSINNTFKLGDISKNWSNAYIRDISASSIDVSGALNVMGAVSAPNLYTKTEVDVSFVSKELFDASLSSIQLTNVYTKTEVDVSFVSKQLFDASINALATSSGGGSSTSIYDTNIKILPDWTPIVEISNSLYTGQNFDFGRYIVYSNDGTTLATCLLNLTISGLQFAGRVIIYHNNGSSWVQKGQNLDGTQALEYFGRALSLSSNGNIIAIGSNNIEPNTNRRGSVKIYSYNLSTLLWEQIGGALRNFNTNFYNTYTEHLGNHVALSGDGTVLIVGAMQSDLYSGRVISYKYEIRNTILDWYVTGIVGYYTFINDFNINTYNFSHEYFGSRVALSLDGTVMAVYAAYAPAEHGDGDNTTVSNIFYSGVTRTFKWNGSAWVQTGRFIGQTREAYPIESANFLSTGTIISLSGNGNTIAIGEPNNISNGYNNGKVSVYYWNNNDNSWNKLGADIYGEGSTLRSDNNADDEVLLGISVSLSNDGTIIAVTGREAPYNYSSYPQKGRVYKFEGTAWNKLGHSFREGRFIALSGDGNYLAVGNSFNSLSWAAHGMNRISMSIYTLVSNKIVSLNSTNLFFNDGYSYSYKKRNIHNLNLVNNDANAVHTDFFSDFPNKFTRILYIAQNGDLYNRNNTYGSFSDIRLKENIIDATPKLQDLLKVRVVNYNLKGSTNKQIGVLAQELEEIFPGLVETENSGEKYKSVKYSCINIMLVKALQEQQVLINDMSSNINTLKDEIATLKQNMASLLTRLQALEAGAN